jgi:succinyl-diaminopimelate desuccinylase
METEFTTLEQRLALLMEMPTVTDEDNACQAAVQSLADELSSLGMYVTPRLGKRPNLVATTRNSKHPRVLLVAHLDVVPPTNGAHCKLRVDGDKLTGRGVFDMKFAAACYLELVHELNGRGELAQYDFGIMFTTDEEVGGEQGVGELLADGWNTDLAVIPDGGENWEVELGAKGLAFLQLTARGRSAHGSRPWEGDNAIDKLVAVLNDVRAEYPYNGQDEITVSINQVTGGQAMNQIADHAQTIIDMRAFTLDELKTAEDFIRQAGQKHSVDVEYLIGGNPVALDIKNQAVRTSLDVLKQFLGAEPTFTKSYGATDGRWFAYHGIPTFIIRPQGGDIHGPGEWMLRQDLPKFYDFLRQLTEEIALAGVDSATKQAQTNRV